MSDQKKNHGTNRLILEKSPYLLQHAANPVNWFPWGNEAFETAKREDKPVFLSIGYSTCHWCHVMERESFENEEVARLMNQTFISIKLDREERPDIDSIYMSVCQMMTGSGGWPLTIIMTPDKKPFFAATYIPKNARFGRPGMMELIPRIRELWQTRRQDLTLTADRVTSAIREQSSDLSGDEITGETLDASFNHFRRAFDPVHGGFGSRPKFPTPHNLLFLLRHWRRTGDKKALEIVEHTLRFMRKGGIFDHVGFGFHRYSTDEKWLVPHFEKMLYDQALLAMAYIEAFQATGREEYGQTAREIFTYVLRDMTSPEGGFYSAEDADSEGEEGKFYLWTEAEIREILDREEAEQAARHFNVETAGNFRDEAMGIKTGRNILHTGEHSSETVENLERIRQKLFKAREMRIRPMRDDKILTDWNGLMIAALAMGGRSLGDPRYTEAARRAADFILQNMRKPDGTLLHRFREGDAAISAGLNDYVFLSRGFIELYEATFEPQYLKTALELTDAALEKFRDEETGGFFMSPEGAPDLIARPRDLHDGAIPSGNSVAALNLLRLSRMTGRADYEETAAGAMRSVSGLVHRSPGAFSYLLCAADFALGPSYEVVVAGKPGAPDTTGMLEALNRGFFPNKVLLFHPMDEKSPEIHELAGFIRDQKSLGGNATAYVCRNHACQSPTTSKDDLLEMLQTR